jgi:Helix-turn-helix domain
MPWRECPGMDERLRFVARLLEGEKMAPLCAEFGISRKTGYKFFNRYQDCGVHAFTDRSRRADRQANRLPPQRAAGHSRRRRLAAGSFSVSVRGGPEQSEHPLAHEPATDGGRRFWCRAGRTSSRVPATYACHEPPVDPAG